MSRPENRNQSGAIARDAKGRFRAGTSGNVGGRPRSLSTTILGCRPRASEDLIAFWSTIAFSSSAAIKRRYGVAPRLQDRLAAAAELADRLHGRPVQSIEIEDDRPLVPAFALPPGFEYGPNVSEPGIAGPFGPATDNTTPAGQPAGHDGNNGRIGA